jgi:protein ImuB
VTVGVEPTPARVVQFSLLTRALPSPERLSTLTARLGALMGEGRCGSPALLDSWRPGAHAVMPFAPREAASTRRIEPPDTSDCVVVALRRFRTPVAAAVRTDNGRPAHVTTGRRDLGGLVEVRAGPWRTSGLWWENGAWDRDEWDVTLRGSVTCRLFRDRGTNAWFVEGIVD